MIIFNDIIGKGKPRSPDLLFNLIDLFQELKRNEFKKEHLEEFAIKIIQRFNRKFKDEGVSLSYERYLAEKINYAFTAVYRDIAEIEEDSVEINIVSEITDGDIIPYDNEEPVVDLSSLKDKPIVLDYEYMKLMGCEDE